VIAAAHEPADSRADRAGIRLDQDGRWDASHYNLRELATVDWSFTFAAAARNLMRMPKLLVAAT
jgi:hypothetical protein